MSKITLSPGNNYRVQGNNPDEWYPAHPIQIGFLGSYGPKGGQGGYVLQRTQGETFQYKGYRYAIITDDLVWFYMKNLDTGMVRAFINVYIPVHSGAKKDEFLSRQYPDDQTR